MYGRDVSELRKKKAWTDIQGNNLGHLLLPQSPSDSLEDEGMQSTREAFFLEQYNPVIAGACLHLSAVYGDSSYLKIREIWKFSLDGSSAAPQGYSWYPTAICHADMYPSHLQQDQNMHQKGEGLQSSVMEDVGGWTR